MKKIALSFFALCLAFNSFGQDTITTGDLPSANDIFIISTGQSFTGMDATLTGANFAWDYSQLTRNGQDMDTFRNVSTTGSLLSLYFIDNGFNPNRANQATPGQNFQLGLAGITDVIDFFYNSASSYSKVGFGATVNGVALPLAYSPHDVIYNLPLHYNDQDSSVSGYEVDLTSTIGIYYKVNYTRNNLVDGWGSLTTPLGTFDVLRVKSTVTEQDSIYVDSLGFGFKTPAITTLEYKWLGKNAGIPLLQINIRGGISTEILYQDSLDDTGINDVNVFSDEPSVFPNPASKNIFVTYSLKSRSDVLFSLYSLDGKEIFTLNKNDQSSGKNILPIDLTNYNLSPGNYFLKIEAGKDSYSTTILVKP